jgi:hypothetical protein
VKLGPLGSMTALAAALVIAAAPLSAQKVTGTVVDAGRKPIPEATVSLQTEEGRMLATAVTDTAGVFDMRAPRFGRFYLHAERIGYESVRSAVDVNLAEQVDLLVVLDIAAVTLEPLTVTARSPFDMGRLGEYYERMADNQRLGIGRFMTRDQIDLRGALEMVELLREFPRVTALQDNRGQHIVFQDVRGACTPAVFIDGALANRQDRAFLDELVRPYELEGIEIYQGVARLPGRYHDATGCGVILLWTRRELAGPGRPFSWRRVLLVGAAAMSIFVAMGR